MRSRSPLLLFLAVLPLAVLSCGDSRRRGARRVARAKERWLCDLTCPRGSEEEGGECADVNECLLPDACPEDALCENTEGAHQCRCGFFRSWDGQECVFVGNQEATCINSGDLAWRLSGDDSCAMLGLSCTGLDFFSDNIGCLGEAYTGGWGSQDCCASSLSGHAGEDFDSALWACF